MPLVFVDEVRNTVEHPVYGAKCLLVVEEDQAEHQVFDPATPSARTSPPLLYAS